MLHSCMGKLTLKQNVIIFQNFENGKNHCREKSTLNCQFNKMWYEKGKEGDPPYTWAVYDQNISTRKTIIFMYNKHRVQLVTPKSRKRENSLKSNQSEWPMKMFCLSSLKILPTFQHVAAQNSSGPGIYYKIDNSYTQVSPQFKLL